MKPERIEELRATSGVVVTVSYTDGTQRIFDCDPIRSECLDEIEKLQRQLCIAEADAASWETIAGNLYDALKRARGNKVTQDNKGPTDAQD